MLTEERFAEILRMLGEEKSVTVQELTERLATSESTIRRDLTALAEKGLLVKVHGGATALEMDYTTKDVEITSRMTQNVDEKSLIGKYAASLIEKEDFVYLDSGSSIAQMLKYMTGSGAVFVTNGIAHAQSLARKGITVYLVGGMFKGATDAVIGSQAVEDLKKYNFTKGFFGTNGVTKEQGFTTPEVKEALIKRRAMEQTKEAYVLADASKFGEISTVTFGAFADATILTNQVKQEYRGFSNIKEVEE